MIRGKVQVLQKKAIAARYGNPASGIELIVVVGVAGKTTVSRFLASMLKESGRPVGSLTDDAGITSATNLYKKLAVLKKQQVGTVILEVNEALLDTGALVGLTIETLVVVNENEVAHRLLAFSPKHVVAPTGFSISSGSVEPYQHISVGSDVVADAKIDTVKLYRNGTELNLTIDHQTKLEVATYFSGYASALDLATAIAAAYVLGVDLSAVQEGVADLESSAGIFNWTRTNQQYEVIQDNARWDESVRLAIDSTSELAKRRLIVAFDQLPSEDMVDFVRSKADRIFVVGEKTDTQDIDIEVSTRDAFDKALRAARRDDAVLLLGPNFIDLIDLVNDVTKDPVR
jgi:UDP-N-acetylmuramyl pentapeptide synthase